jgi:protein SCO1/2
VHVPRAWLILPLAVLGAGLVTLVVLVGLGAPPPPPTFHGVPQARERLPAGIVLLDHHRRAFALDALGGRVTVLTFGYTHCPDVCPTALLTLARVRSGLGAAVPPPEALFVTTDPARDTPERLRWYVSLFDARITGLTGTPQALTRLHRAFNVYPARYALGTGAHGYRVSHATAIYLIDPDRVVRFSYSWGVAAEDLLSDARRLLQGH